MLAGSTDDIDVVHYDHLLLLLNSILRSAVRGDSVVEWRTAWKNDIATQNMKTSGGTSNAFYDWAVRIMGSILIERMYSELSSQTFLALSVDKRGDLLSCVAYGVSSTGRTVIDLGVFECAAKDGESVASMIARTVPSNVLQRVHMITTDRGPENRKLGDYLGGIKWCWCAPHRLDKVVEKWSKSRPSLVKLNNWMRKFSTLVGWKSYFGDDLVMFVQGMAELQNVTKSSFYDAPQRWLSKLGPCSSLVHSVKPIAECLKNYAAKRTDKKTRDMAFWLLWNMDETLVASCAMCADVLAVSKICLGEMERDDCDLATCSKAVRSLRVVIQDMLSSVEDMKTKLTDLGNVDDFLRKLQSDDDYKQMRETLPHCVSMLENCEKRLDFSFRKRGSLKTTAYNWYLDIPHILWQVLETWRYHLETFQVSYSNYFGPQLGMESWEKSFGLEPEYEIDTLEAVVELCNVYGLGNLQFHYVTWLTVRERARKCQKRLGKHVDLINVWAECYKELVETYADTWQHNKDFNEAIFLVGVFCSSPCSSAKKNERVFALTTRLREKKKGLGTSKLRVYQVIQSLYHGLGDDWVSLVRHDDNTIEACDIITETCSRMIVFDMGKKYRRLMGAREIRPKKKVVNVADVDAIKRAKKESKRKRALKRSKKNSSESSSAPNPRKYRPNYQPVREEHKAMMSNAIKKVGQIQYDPPPVSDRLEHHVRLQSTFNAAAFAELPPRPLDEYDDVFYRRMGSDGACVVVLRHVQSHFAFKWRSLLNRYIQRNIGKLWHSLSWQNDVADGSAFRVRLFLETVQSKILEVGGIGFVRIMEKDDEKNQAVRDLNFFRRQIQTDMAKLPHERTAFQTQIQANTRKFVSRGQTG